MYTLYDIDTRQPSRLTPCPKHGTTTGFCEACALPKPPKAPKSQGGTHGRYTRTNLVGDVTVLARDIKTKKATRVKGGRIAVTTHRIKECNHTVGRGANTRLGYCSLCADETEAFFAAQKTEHQQIFAVEGEGMLGTCLHVTGTAKKDVLIAAPAPELMPDRECENFQHFATTGEAAPRIMPARRRFRSIYVDGLTQLERQIFEDAHLSNGVPMLPHLNVVDKLYFRKASFLKYKLRCTAQEAERMSELLTAFELSEKDSLTMIAQAKQEPVLNDWLVKYEWLHFEATPAQTLLDDVTIIIREANDDIDHDDEDLTPEEKPYAVPDYLAFHRIDETPDQPDWFKIQPDWYRAIIRQITTSQSLKALKAVGSANYNNNRFNKDQSGVFWYTYKRFKNRLIGEPGLKAQKWIAAMSISKRSTGYMASQIKTKGSQFTEGELHLIWEAWRALKNSKTAAKAADSPPDDASIAAHYASIPNEAYVIEDNIITEEWIDAVKNLFFPE